jgi:hypothetical protein
MFTEGRLLSQQDFRSMIKTVMLRASPIAKMARMNFTTVMVMAGWVFGAESFHVSANTNLFFNARNIPNRVRSWSL